MAPRIKPLALAVLAALASLSVGCGHRAPDEKARSIVTSDTILSGMCASLLPAGSFTVDSIMPPGQCPGHYDMKLSDLVKAKEAVLVVSFVGMPFMRQAETDANRQLLVDAQDRNWMAPHSYAAGLNMLADRLAERFPEYAPQIRAGLERAVGEVAVTDRDLSDTLARAGIGRKPVIASSMLREPLEWMGLRVVGEYGRPESISAKQIASLIRIGSEERAVMVVDNLQSGPEAGKGIAEALGVPHVIFSNFPSEKGYAATLGDNVRAALAALGAK